jgi:hypothetical protein
MSYIDRDRLAYFLSKLKLWVQNYAPSKSVATPYYDGLMSAGDKAKLDGISIDDALNSYSVNPVQNKAIAVALQNLRDDFDDLAARTGSAYTYKGTVSTYADLPSSGNQVGDVYDVLTAPDDGSWAWNGSEWYKMSGFVDLSGLATKDVVTYVSDGLMSSADKVAFDALMQGLVPLWSSSVDYSAGMLVRGSDGFLYVSKQASGPGEGGAADPAQDSAGTHWGRLSADDQDVVHKDGAETVTGQKTFSQPVVGDVSVLPSGATTRRLLSDALAASADVKSYGAAGDGVTDDAAAVSAAAATGAMSLPAGVYASSVLPAYADVSGAGDVLHGHFLYDAKSLSNKYPFQNCHMTAIDVDEKHKGLNSHLFYDAANAKLVCVYRRSDYHGVHPSEYMMRHSYDNGQTWSYAVSLYSRAGTDCRCSVSYDGPEAWIVLVTCRVCSADNATYAMPRSLVSLDRGETWNVYDGFSYADGTAIDESAVPSWNFHGSIYKFGGKLVAYAYHGPGGHIDAFVSEDAGLTWKIHSAVIVRPSGTAELSETSIAKVGSQLVAFIRSDTSYCRIALGLDGTGLSFAAPFYSQIPLGTNPYSSIIEDDKNRSWILFCDRKNSLGDSYFKNSLFALLVDSDLLASNFADYKLRSIIKTPHYSVGHFWAVARTAGGRYVGVVNAGEVNGTSAALYCLTEETPAALSRSNLCDIVAKPNLLTNGGFKILRYKTTDTANYRYKYFCDGWRFVHSNSDAVNFAIQKLNKIQFTAFNGIVSDRYCTFKPISTNSVVLMNYNPVGSFGFMQPVTVSFYAKASAPGASFGNVFVTRYGAQSDVSENKSFSSISSDVKTFWKKFVGTISGFTYAELSAGDYAASGSYDALALTFNVEEPGIEVSVTDVKLEFGSLCSPVEYGEADLVRCNRFFYATYTNADSLTSSAGSVNMVAATSGSSNNAMAHVFFPVQLASAPAVTVYSTATGAAGKVYNRTTHADVDAEVSSIGLTGCEVANAGAVSAGDVLRFHLVADSRV